MSKTVKPQFTHRAAADFNTDVFIGFYRLPSSLFHIWPQIILNTPKSHELQLFFTSAMPFNTKGYNISKTYALCRILTLI